MYAHVASNLPYLPQYNGKSPFISLYWGNYWLPYRKSGMSTGLLMSNYSYNRGYNTANALLKKNKTEKQLQILPAGVPHGWDGRGQPWRALGCITHEQGKSMLVHGERCQRLAGSVPVTPFPTVFRCSECHE